MSPTFPPLKMLFQFQMAYFALIICIGNEGKLLVPLLDKMVGNLNIEWAEWTKAHYNIHDQCMANPYAGGLDQQIGSYRLHFYCSTKKCKEAEGAKLYICYPSTLDRDALPDKNPAEGEPPILRPTNHISVRNDPDHEITKICSELMAHCAKDPQCREEIRDHPREEIWDRPIHGFSVQRENGEFIIELPFGKNGIGKNFTVFDDFFDPGRFYINLGDATTVRRTYVVHGAKSYDKYKKNLANDDGNKNIAHFYSVHSSEGMPLSRGQHLWMLGIDILGMEEQQAQYFYTKGVPNQIIVENCHKNTTKKLAKKPEIMHRFINAQFFTPSDQDPSDGDLPNIHEEGYVPEPDVNKHIIVGKNEGHEYIEELSSGLPNIELIFSAWLPENAAKFSVLLYHGSKEFLDILGQKVMEIVVVFNENNILVEHCSVNSFLPNNVLKKCNKIEKQFTDPNVPTLALRKGKKFWLWIRIQNGHLEIVINCMDDGLKFAIGTIPYSPESFLKFSGDLELDKYGKRNSEDVVADVTSGGSLDGKSPALVVQKVDGFKENNLIIINGKLAPQSNDQIGIEILFTNTKISDRFWFENCPTPEESEKSTAKPVVQCPLADGYCLKGTINGGPDGLFEQICLHSFTDFNFIFSCMTKKDEIEKDQYIAQLYLNGYHLADSSSNNCDADYSYVQVQGDLELPIRAKQFDFVYKNSKNDEVYKSTFNSPPLHDNNYLNIHLWRFGKNDMEQKIQINLLCNCYQGKDKDVIYLQIEINFKQNSIIASSFEPYVDEEGKSLTLPVQNNTSNFLSLENPILLKIMANYKESNKYKIYGNGVFLLEIDKQNKGSKKFYREYANAIRIEGNVAVFSKPYAFPFQFVIQEENTHKPNNLSPNLMITFKFRILKNTELIEFFVAKGPSVKLLGTTDQNQFDNNNKNNVLFMHMRAIKDRENGIFCISSALIKDSSCPEFLQNQGQIVELLNAATFQEDNVHELKITFVNKEYAIIELDGNEPHKFKAPNNDLWEASKFVINGEITIINTPQKFKV